MNKTQIKARIKELQNKNILKEFPEYVKANNAVTEAVGNRFKIQMKIIQGDEYKQKELVKYDELKRLHARLEGFVDPEIEKINKWLNGSYSSGIDFGPSPALKVRRLTKNKEYAVVTNKGHMYWCGLGSQTYGQSCHWVVKVFGAHYDKNKHCPKDIENYDYGDVKGRLSKKQSEQLLEFAQKLEDQNESI